MADWVELLERKEQDQRREKVRVVNEELPAATRQARASRVGEVASLAVVVLLVGGSLWWLSSSLDGGEPNNVAAQQTSSTAQPLETAPANALAESARVLVTGSDGCRAEADQISEEKDSLRAAIVEFEEAYFAHDAERLVAVLAKDSELRDQDWSKVLGNEVPQEVSWCMEIAPSNGTTADTDLQMKIPGDGGSTFRQVFTGELTDAGWRITKIEPRKGKS